MRPTCRHSDGVALHCELAVLSGIGLAREARESEKARNMAENRNNAELPRYFDHRGVVGAIRLYFERSRSLRQEREIAAFIERKGGRFTDDLERQIENYVFSSTWTPPRV